MQQNFLQHCSSCLRFLHNYFDSPTKLDLYLSKFLDTSAKSFRIRYFKQYLWSNNKIESFNFFS